ncbi:MAG: aminopeptidase [Eubacteriales bacterium]|nr:aminopeptidase [Eubacteriales bacterium]
MTHEVFLLCLLIVATMTGLVTEAVKKYLKELDKTYRSNILAGTVAAVLSVAVGIAYMILTETAINSKMAVYLIALAFLSWLSAMVGYDKVIQTITQFKKKHV